MNPSPKGSKRPEGWFENMIEEIAHRSCFDRSFNKKKQFYDRVIDGMSMSTFNGLFYTRFYLVKIVGPVLTRYSKYLPCSDTFTSEDYIRLFTHSLVDDIIKTLHSEETSINNIGLLDDFIWLSSQDYERIVSVLPDLSSTDDPVERELYQETYEQSLMAGAGEEEARRNSLLALAYLRKNRSREMEM